MEEKGKTCGRIHTDTVNGFSTAVDLYICLTSGSQSFFNAYQNFFFFCHLFDSDVTCWSIFSLTNTPPPPLPRSSSMLSRRQCYLLWESHRVTSAEQHMYVTTAPIDFDHVSDIWRQDTESRQEKDTTNNNGVSSDD